MSDEKIYLPQQNVKPGKGKAGYKGKNIEVVKPGSKAAKSKSASDE